VHQTTKVGSPGRVMTSECLTALLVPCMRMHHSQPGEPESCTAFTHCLEQGLLLLHLPAGCDTCTSSRANMADTLWFFIGLQLCARLSTKSSEPAQSKSTFFMLLRLRSSPPIYTCNPLQNHRENILHQETHAQVHTCVTYTPAT